jgi:hypothetical protein
MKSETKVAVAFTLAILIIGGVGVYSYLGIQGQESTNRSVVHTHEVLENLEHLVKVLVDAETGERGFILTGEESYLEPFNASLEKIPKDLDTITALTADNPAQQQDIAQLKKRSRDMLDLLQETIALRRSGGLDAVLPVIRSGRSKTIMDDIRVLVDRMESRERQLLDQRDREARQVALNSSFTVAVGALLSLLVLAAAALFLTRTMRLTARPAESRVARRNWAGLALRYAFAVALVALATGARWWLIRKFGPMPLFITWYPAILLVATVAGGGPGIAATLLSVIVSDYWFIEPVGSFGIANANDAVAMGIFSGSGLLISLLAERLRRARRAEAVSAAQEEELDLLNQGTLISLDLQHHITHWSEGARRLYGFTTEEAVGQVTYEIFRPKFPLPLEQINKTLEEQGHWEGELIRRRKDGTELTVVLLWAMRRDDHGRPAAILEVSNDITGQKAAEAKLHQIVEELKRSNQELEQFAYVSSHDLQEPLRMVTGFMQLLSHKYTGKLDAQADTYINFAVDGAKRMQQLIDDLLAFSRVGSKAREPAPTDAAQLVQTALANLRVAIDETKAQINLGPLPTVLADGPQLVLVFQNLIGNAIKFRGSEAPIIEVSARRDGEAWLFSVKDNGIGFSPEFHEKVFMIFQRLHTKDKYPGTGIGLAICKKIVERHHGRIWADSTPGQGSTFFFTLPALPM